MDKMMKNEKFGNSYHGKERKKERKKELNMVKVIDNEKEV